MAKYIVRHTDGSTDGPLTSAELMSLAYEGRIGADDQIAQVGDSRWIPATRVGGIREIIEQLTPLFEESESQPPAAPEIAPSNARAAESASTPLPTPATAAATPPMTPIIDDSPLAPPTRAPSRQTPVPQYPILRCVAGWIAWYGWIIIGLALGLTVFLTVLLTLLLFRVTLDPVQTAAVFTMCIAGGVAIGLAIRTASTKGSHIVGWAALVALLPVLPSLGIWMQDGLAGLASLFGSLWLAAATLGAVILGMVMIAISELFIAHADIATNSWKRLA
jgi:hypothetical protein